MKTSTKWILGIVIGLTAIAAIAAIGFLVVSQWSGGGWTIAARSSRFWDGSRDMPWHALPWNAMPLHQPIMPGYRFGGFSAVRMAASALVCLGILALIVLGIAALVRSLSRPPQPAVAPARAIEPDPAPALACPNCGRTVQDDWSHCPFCGTALADKTGGEMPSAGS
jgi:hypothetical protein